MAKFETFEVTVELHWDASDERIVTVKCKEPNVRELALQKARKQFGTENIKVVRYRKV